MLVLSRKIGESVIIGGRVVVTIARVRSKCVSLHITAPTEVRVDRGEIHAQIQAKSALPEEGV